MSHEKPSTYSFPLWELVGNGGRIQANPSKGWDAGIKMARHLGTSEASLNILKLKPIEDKA